MTLPLACLVGFVCWTIALVLSIGGVRLTLIATGHMPAGGFPADTPHGGERYRRLVRAHLNCVENLPLLTAAVLTAHVLRIELPASAAPIYVGARVLQSVTHVASGSFRATRLRFTFFVAQLVSLGRMLVAIIAASL